MNKTIAAITLAGFLAVACSKTETVETSNTVPEVVSDTTMADSLPINQQTNDAGDSIVSYHYIYKDNKGQQAKVTFNNSDTIHTMSVDYRGKKYNLTQTEAWAKGGDYKGEGIEAHSQSGQLTLTVNGEKVVLNQDEEIR